jgi:hypothetical protein
MTEPTAAEGPSPVAAGRRPSLEELARAKGMKPIESVEDLQSYAVPLFDSDEEVEEFLALVRDVRNADLV